MMQTITTDTFIRSPSPVPSLSRATFCHFYAFKDSLLIKVKMFCVTSHEILKTFNIFTVEINGKRKVLFRARGKIHLVIVIASLRGE